MEKYRTHIDCSNYDYMLALGVVTNDEALNDDYCFEFTDYAQMVDFINAETGAKIKPLKMQHELFNCELFLVCEFTDSDYRLVLQKLGNLDLVKTLNDRLIHVTKPHDGYFPLYNLAEVQKNKSFVIDQAIQTFLDYETEV